MQHLTARQERERQFYSPPSRTHEDEEVVFDPAVHEARRVLKPGGIAVFHEFVEVPVFDALRHSPLVTWIEQLDQLFFRALPFTKIFGGDVVMVLHK